MCSRSSQFWFICLGNFPVVRFSVLCRINKLSIWLDSHQWNFSMEWKTRVNEGIYNCVIVWWRASTRSTVSFEYQYKFFSAVFCELASGTKYSAEMLRNSCQLFPSYGDEKKTKKKRANDGLFLLYTLVFGSFRALFSPVAMISFEWMIIDQSDGSHDEWEEWLPL